MTKVRSILVPLILVAALAFGVWAYMDHRNQLSCDRWREDITVATRNAVQALVDAPEEEPTGFVQVNALEKKRPSGCPRPAIGPSE